MLSALSQSSIANSNNSNSSSNNNHQPSQSRSQSPTKKSSSAFKTEPELDIRRINELQEEERQGSSYGEATSAAGEDESSSASNYDSSSNNNRMDYANDDSVHPLAPAPHSSESSSRRNSSAHPSSSSSGQNNYYTSSPAIQPQQHQQLLKLKTEHGFSTAPVPVPDNAGLAQNNSEDMDERSAGSSRRASSSEVNMGGPNESMMVRDDRDDRENEDDDDDDDNELNERSQRLVVDTSSPSMRHDGMSTLVGTPETASLNADTPTTTTGTTAPSSRRGSLRTMTATLPRSALQEETIALFKQYRNLIPCAKCFCRNTIQRDGMSDGNLRFKCRPPVSMSLICNKSYSESKIRNMIAGVVYGHSLPDTNASGGATSPGENVLALAPPPVTKPSRRASTKNDSSPRLGAEITSERLQRLKEDPEEQLPENPLSMEIIPDDRGMSGGHQQHPLDVRRPSQPYPHQGSVSRRASVQQLRRPSLVDDEGMMMDYEDNAPSGPHPTYLQVPGTPPMEGDDSRHYRSRTSYNQPPRSVTPTGPPHPSSGGGPPPTTSGRQGGQKLHHSHSHPNIGQQRHQQYLEQQEREHRGSFSGQGHPSQSSSSSQSQPQRLLQRPLVKRESIHQMGGGPERRSSQPSPNPGSKYLPGPGAMHEAHSPAMISSPRSSPGREMGTHHHSHGSSGHEHSGAPTMRSIPGSAWYEDNNQGYLSRRMSQPHPSYGYSGNHSGLPPAMPSHLAHPYDRRASEIEDYPPVHREKYEKLNASTLLPPGPNGSSSGSSSSSLSRHSLQKMKPLAHPVSPNSAFESRRHPLDPAEPELIEEGGSRQPLTPYSRSGGPGGNSSNPGSSSPWLGSGNGNEGGSSSGAGTPQSEPMRYSHSMGNSAATTSSSSGGGAYPSGPRPSLRHQSSLSNIYHQTPRQDDRDRFEGENEMDMSPDYHDVDADGRPIARMRHQSLKRKSLGQPLARSNSHQNLYSTSMQQQQQHSHSHHSSHHSHHHPQQQQSQQQRDHHSHHHHHHGQYHHSSHHQHQNQHRDQQQNPMSTVPRDHHHHSHHHNQHQQHQDLNAALPPPPNSMGIKMTCFPNALSKTSNHPSPTTKTMDSSEHMALPLSQCSKIVIEIHQPRNAQAYTSAISLPPTAASAAQQQQEQVGSKKESGLPVELRKTSAAAAHLARSSSSIIGHRRSASRDLVSYGACKKRRADSVDDASGLRYERDSLEEEDEDAEQEEEEEDAHGDEDEKATGSVAEAAAAAVVAAAAADTKTSIDVDVDEERSRPEISDNAGPDAIQVFGIDYLAQHQQQPDKKSTGLLGLGLGLPSSTSLSVDKTVDALQVARASSYVVLEDQKEMGVDYSLFTRVETAGWRILIPPNVVASFRSEDFGLMLKPKGLADADMQDQHDAAPIQEQEHQHVQKEMLGEKLLRREDEEEQEEEEVLVFENNEEDDVGTEGVRRIALRDDDSRVEDSVTAVKSVSYYHRHTHHQLQHQQQHHLAQDLEMQDDEETTTAVETVPVTASAQHQSPLPSHDGEQGQDEGQRVVKETEQEGDIEMDRE